jgi:ribosomal subunit interface protein
MRVTISARHCVIDDPLRQRARAVVDRLDQLTPFGQTATVVFDAVPLRHTVEIRFHLSGGRVLVARGEGEDHRTALDRAEAKLRRQLERPAAKPRRKARGPASRP